jgi:hypothetical protein
MSNLPRVKLDIATAKGMLLVESGHVHTLRQPSKGILLGADWAYTEIVDTMTAYEVELSGETATKAGYGLVLIDETGPLFLATKEDPGLRELARQILELMQIVEAQDGDEYWGTMYRLRRYARRLAEETLKVKY